MRAIMLKKTLSETPLAFISVTAINIAFPILCVCSYSRLRIVQNRIGFEQCEADWTGFTISDNK
jgi:hypothetical protein